MKRLSIVLLIVAVISLTVMYIARNRTPEKTIEIDTSRTAVIREIRKLNRLETASFTIEKIIEAGTKGNALKNILFGDKILLIAHGKVIAGFDLSELKENDITVSGKEITLQLPAAMILVTSLDNSKTKVYDRQQGILTKGDSNLESAARQAAEDSILTAACEANILDEASENGRKQLTAFLRALDFEKVTISIPSGKCSL